MTTAMAVPEKVKIESEAARYLQGAKEMIIASPDDNELASAFLRDVVNPFCKTIEQAHKESIEAAHLSHKAAIALRDQHLKPLLEAKQLIALKIGKYLQHEATKRAEADRLAREEAERIAREQQAKLEVEAKRQRDLEAARLKKAGDLAAAKALKAKPIVVEPVHVAAIVPQAAPAKVQGISTKTVWKFTVENPELLPREYTQPDLQKIGAVVKAMGGETRIGGVKVWEEKSISVR